MAITRRSWRAEEAIKLFLVGGGKFAELRDRGGNDFERGGYFLLRGVAAKAEADGGAGFFRA